MKNLILKLRLALVLFALSLLTVTVSANTNLFPVSSKKAPSEMVTVKSSDLSGSVVANNYSIGSVKATSFSSAPKGVVKANFIWGANGGPGTNWEDEPTYVGFPIGDASYIVLASMLALYLAYRSLSARRRKNNL